MSEVGIYEAKTHFPKLIERVQRGEQFIITKHGKAVATLAPLASDKREAHRKAVDELFRIREDLRARGVSIKREEILRWIKEGRR